MMAAFLALENLDDVYVRFPADHYIVGQKFEKSIIIADNIAKKGNNIV